MRMEAQEEKGREYIFKAVAQNPVYQMPVGKLEDKFWKFLRILIRNL